MAEGLALNMVHEGDCLEVMRDIPVGSVDMILADLPYGTTACKWDTVIPFEPLWSEYNRVLKERGAVVMTSKEPFTSALRTSNLKHFKQPLVWKKENADNPMQAKRRHMNIFEDVSVFYRKQCTYNPQGLIEVNQTVKRGRPGTLVDSRGESNPEYHQRFTNYPRNILEFVRDVRHIHPTQKPVALFEYLIRTYTNEGEVVLDNVIGSGTTAVAAVNTNRQFIGIEREPEYVAIANNRISDALQVKQQTEEDE